MHAYRFRWMANAMRRESEMVDGLIQNGLQQGVLFFASTSIILIGAGPDASAAGERAGADELDAWSTKLGKLHSVAAYHFTAGIHACFHALSAMAWLLGPWLFIAATPWVSVVLYRRAFGSRFPKILIDRDDGVPEARTGA